MSTDLKKVFVCDMGIAKVKQLTDASVTCVGNGPGTFPYMAPEMFKACRRGSAVDIYSLGCLYIELFGKKRVWHGLDGPAIMQQVLGSYEVPPCGPSTSHLPSEIGCLCSKLCALDPAERLKSHQVFDAVQRIAEW
jgi:serine/threonine protein kinase